MKYYSLLNVYLNVCLHIEEDKYDKQLSGSHNL